MSLVKRIIPCLDIQAGRVVKGVNFEALRDAGDPVEIAQRYYDAGADEIAFLDIHATVQERHLLLDVIEAVARKIFIPLTVGGGVKTIGDIKQLLNAGADKVSINSQAVANPNLIVEASTQYGAQCIVIAIDAKQTNKTTLHTEAKTSWEVFTHGGRQSTGKDVIDWAQQLVAAGAGEILLTSMDRDGTKSGFDLALTRAVADSVPVPIIASGGVGTLEHLAQGIIDGHADALLAASIFHYGDYNIRQAKEFLAERGIPVRLTQT